MSSSIFDNLRAYRPRRFVPATLEWRDQAAVDALFDRLEKTAARCSTRAELESWLNDWSELSAAVDEEGSRRYIAMTTNTEDPEAERAYLEFVEQIEPRLKPRQFRLEQLLVDHPVQLPEPRYGVFLRDTRTAVELFRQANVPLETEEAKLGQQYQKLAGSLTVQYKGEEKTLSQMGRFLEEPDRAVRQEAWELVAKRRLEVADAFENYFDQLVALRHQIALNAGFPHYVDYSFRAKRRFDYTPEDCRRFHEAIATVVMPLVRRLEQRRREQLGLAQLRPWDLGVDPAGRPPLSPFKHGAELMDKSEVIFARLDPELAEGFALMRRFNLLDLENRKGKAPGGYQSTLSEARLPFIFMNAVGLHRDVTTMLHEAGHAFHALATRPEDLYHYRHAPIEFCEVASMSMELLGNRYLEEFYSPDQANRARQDHLEGIIQFFPWMATVDAFQHWIYRHPTHRREDRTAAWLELMDQFGAGVDWSGYEQSQAHLWHRQLHIFLHPLYYVEYGIAQLGALQVWAQAKADQSGALRAYRTALALGGSRPLPQLFQAAGCQLKFDASTLEPLMALVQSEWEKL